MEKIPILICIDVEPDEREISSSSRKAWKGFEKTFNWFQQLRSHLQTVTQSSVTFSWFVRMDPQVAYTYGSPEWPIRYYRDLFEELELAGDEIGLHTHAWRRDEASHQWIADMADQQWVDHCVRTSFDAFEQSLHRPCRSFRFGDHWINEATLDLVESLGARFDLTIEPGLKDFYMPGNYTGSPPDYTSAPREPYHPSRVDFRRRTADARTLRAIPLSTCDADLVFGSIRGAAERPREPGNGKNGQRKRWWKSRDVFEGSLDRADRRVIEGWVYNARKPDAPIDVEIYDGAELLAIVTADGLRVDLVSGGKGNGRHCFSLPTPSRLQDRHPRTIRAKVAHSEFELSHSPRQFSENGGWNEGGLLLLPTNPWLMSRSIEVLLGALSKPYLALPIRSDVALYPAELANVDENINSLLRNPSSAETLVFETPAEMTARFA